MSCQSCLVSTCQNPNDLGLYSLETNVYYSPQLAILVTCPPGYTCQPGFQQYSVTIPAQTFAVSMPVIFVNGVTVGAAPLRLQCCQTELSVPVPDGLTQAQVLALAQGMVVTCAQQQAVCDSFLAPAPGVQPPFPNGFLNNQQCFQPLNCQPGFFPVINGQSPGFLSVNGMNVCIAAGLLQQPDSQAQADSAAMALLQSSTAALISNGVLKCQFPSNIWNLSWGTPTISQVNGGTASGSESFAGFDISTATPANNTAFGEFSISASQTYTGPSISVNLQVVVTVTGFSHGSGYSFNLTQDGVVIASKVYNDETTGTNTFQFPFTLNVGTNSLIQFSYDQISSGINSGGAATTLHCVGSFTSTPP